MASNTTAALWEERLTKLEQLLSCCQDSRRSLRVFRDEADLLLKKIEGMLVNTALQDEQRSEAHLSHFKQQKKFLEKILESHCPSDNTVVGVEVLTGFKEKIENIGKVNYIECRRSTTKVTTPFVFCFLDRAFSIMKTKINQQNAQINSGLIYY